MLFDSFDFLFATLNADECPFYVSGLQELITQIVRPIVFFVALGFMFLLHKLLVWILSAKCLCGRVTRTSRKWLFYVSFYGCFPLSPWSQ